VSRTTVLIDEGLVPGAGGFAGERFPLDRFGEALAGLDRRVPGRTWP
jgi:hypothetical protein